MENNNDNTSNESWEEVNNISISPNDVLIIIAKDKNPREKDNITNLVCKMIVFKETISIILEDISCNLKAMQIANLHIFSINNKWDASFGLPIKGPSTVNYMEMGMENFTSYLNTPAKFEQYNKDSIYIIKNASYIDVKKLITKIEDKDVSIGRGGGQKAHILSPLDLRLSSYLMAMFDFNYEYISQLNTFNILPKSRYLTYFKD